MCAGDRGASFPVCSAGYPDRSYFLAAQPKPTAATEVAVTVTESKNAEEALRASETRYRRLFESAKDGILILDFDTGKVVDANPFLISLLGYSHAEFLGKNVWDLSPSKDVAVSRDAFRELQEKEYVRYEDLPLEASDGRLISVEFVSNVYLVGQTKVIQCNIRDITERKRTDEVHKKLERQLQVSQKMEAIGILAGGVAHDFNNLLSVILSYTEFAMQALREGDPLKADLLEVKKAGDRAAVLTRQLLAFGRKQLLQPVALSLNHVAEGVEKMLRRILGEDIDFVQVLAPDLGVVRADPGQMEQVLMNLVVNARDAMSAGGKLTIETSNVELDEEYAAHHVSVKAGPYVMLAVTDTGCGMDEQTKTQLFEPFFTTKEKGKGTGLGLSTVYGIVKQSGGNIWVYSELGLGTTFKIYLPRELSVKATATRLRAILQPARGTETILLVEDEEALRKVAKRSLEAAGYTVLVASAGDEALLVSAQHTGVIHLLLTDVVMPRMSGKMLAYELVKTRPTTKVLYMSGYADNAFVHHGVVDEKTHFISKPFTATEIVQRIRSVLDHHVDNVSEGQEQAPKADAVVNEQPLDRAALQALPGDILASLRKAVAAARYDEIVAIVETIRITEPDVATRLRRMTDIFDYDGVQDLLGQ
jgi:two-component system cell cycle sensor histidine kinase/response regulator CckA